MSKKFKIRLPPAAAAEFMEAKMKEASHVKDKDTDKHNEIIEILKKNFKDIKYELRSLQDYMGIKMEATGDEIVTRTTDEILSRKSRAKIALSSSARGVTKHKRKKSTKRKRTFRIK